MPTDPLFYLVGLSVVFLIDFGKGAFGGGTAILERVQQKWAPVLRLKAIKLAQIA
jgi:hypothetical protein